MQLMLMNDLWSADMLLKRTFCSECYILCLSEFVNGSIASHLWLELAVVIRIPVGIMVRHYRQMIDRGGTQTVSYDTIR